MVSRPSHLGFFPSNARWLSPGRLSSRKDNCIVQIHRIKAVATSSRPSHLVEHLRNDWVRVFVLHDLCNFSDECVGVVNSCMICAISLMNASGSSTSAGASASGLSSTMAMSISPPSFLIGLSGHLASCSELLQPYSHKCTFPLFDCPLYH